MKKKIMVSILVGVSLMLSSCGGSSPPAAATGWVIGQSMDQNHFPPIPTPKILKTGDGGASWTLQTLPAQSVGFNGNDISAVNSLVAWASLGNCKICRTTHRM